MPKYPHALPLDYQLQEYKIESVLASGSFSITYKVQDINLKKLVAIKEYLPNEFASREGQPTVKLKSSGNQGDYERGMELFLDEAQILANFDHPHLNKVHRYFKANSTAYLVLEYIAGDTLSHILKEKGQLNETGLRRMLDELLGGLKEVHAANYVHRDIKPANIIFRPDGSAILIDFGVARQTTGQHIKRISSMLTPCYAPIEQYEELNKNIGPWSDLYALGITAYCCLRGDSESILIDAVARARLLQKGETDRDMPAAAVIGRGNYSPALLAAIDWAIQVNENERPQSVAQMQAALAGQTTTTSKVPPRTSVPPRTKAQPGKTKKAWAVEHWTLTIIGLLVITLALSIGIPMYNEWQAEKIAAEARRIADERAEAEHIDGTESKDVNVKNDDGRTPLHWAALLGYSEVIESLLNLGADVNAQDDNGRTLLHSAALEGHSEMVEFLLERDARVNAKNNDGYTPLHWAAGGGHSEVVETLLKQGADVNAENNDGTTPLDVAVSQGKYKVVEVLRRNGGRCNNLC